MVVRTLIPYGRPARRLRVSHLGNPRVTVVWIEEARGIVTQVSGWTSLLRHCCETGDVLGVPKRHLGGHWVAEATITNGGNQLENVLVELGCHSQLGTVYALYPARP